MALRYVLSPIHTVTRVIFKGDLGLSEGTLRGRMIERFGATPPLARAADVAAALEELYHERGYLHASVKPAPPIFEHNPDRATLVFDVKAGPRTTIARSTVTGHPLEPAAQIQARLQILPGQPYQPGELRTRLADYVTSMRRRHYYEATAAAQPPVMSEDGTRADVTVDVQPGPLVTIEFTGDPLPKDKIAELVPIEREGSVDQDLLEDSARRIVDYLNQQGYWKAEVAPPERKEADGRLTLVFHVKRGQLYRVAPGGVEVTGNQSVPIEELRPLLKMSQGDVFVASKLGAIASAITQVYKQKGFATVQVDSAANEVGEGLVKPVIVIKEGPRVLVGSVADHRQPGDRGRSAHAAADAEGRRSVLRPDRGARSRCDPDDLSQRRLRVRGRDRAARRARRHARGGAGRRHVQDRRRAADDRRAHLHHRQPAHEAGDHPARAAAAAGGAARARGHD